VGTEANGHALRYAAPSAIFSVARVLLLVSIFLPYWHMTLHAPQYPNNLRIAAYVNQLTGDTREIDGLNHYIGMRSLSEGATLERATSIWMIIAMVLLVEGAAFVHTRWAVLLAIPVILFPAGFVADLFYWLHTFGQHLDPHAPLSSSVKPFTPPVFGTGMVGQFKTDAAPGLGLVLASVSSLLVIVGFYFHRRAYKPLAERALKAGALCVA
jgi:hypothetical protein